MPMRSLSVPMMPTPRGFSFPPTTRRYSSWTKRRIPGTSHVCLSLLLQPGTNERTTVDSDFGFGFQTHTAEGRRDVARFEFKMYTRRRLYLRETDGYSTPIPTKGVRTNERTNELYASHARPPHTRARRRLTHTRKAKAKRRETTSSFQKKEKGSTRCRRHRCIHFRRYGCVY